MKSLLASLVLVLLGISAYGQQPGTVPPSGTRSVTTTRLVAVFSELERQLVAATQKNDQTTLDRLLSSDFELWTPKPPGAPMARPEWLQNMKTAVPREFSIRQMSVRGLDDHAVASFVLLEGAGARMTAAFVVDLWERKVSEWKLTDRYTSRVQAAPYTGGVKPTGKD